MVSLSTISAQGHSTQVDSAYAGNFQTLLNKLTATGYKINDIGGYNNRNIAGTNTLSKHAAGDALDINSESNPVTYGGSAAMQTDIPDASGLASDSGGLSWGGDWTHSKRDPMHFEVVGSTTPMGDASNSTDPQSADAGATTSDDGTTPVPLDYVRINPDGSVSTAADKTAATVITGTSATAEGSDSSVAKAIVTAGNQQATSNTAALKAVAAASSANTQSTNAANTGLISSFMDWATNRTLQVMVFVLAAIFILIGLWMFGRNNNLVPSIPMVPG